MGGIYNLKDEGEILGVFLEKPGKVPRVHDECPIPVGVEDDQHFLSTPQALSGDSFR